MSYEENRTYISQSEHEAIIQRINDCYSDEIINRKIIKEVKIMYEKNPEISNKEISERTGLSGSSVTRIMQEIC